MATHIQLLDAAQYVQQVIRESFIASEEANETDTFESTDRLICFIEDNSEEANEILIDAHCASILWALNTEDGLWYRIETWSGERVLLGDGSLAMALDAAELAYHG